LLVLLAARTAIDSAVTHAATEGKPLDAKLVVEVMNLLTSRADLQDLRNLRLVCKLTYRGSFPVPSYPLLEQGALALHLQGPGVARERGRGGER
jgi:hypothetical protein